MNSAIEQLKKLTNKQNIFLTESGDHAIAAVLKQIKTRASTLLIQDQGGWLTYKDYALKEKLTLIELKTDYGIIDLTDLKTRADEKSALLVNSLTGYCAEQPMQQIEKICKQKRILLINDVSGSIGTNNAKAGDIILGSFGKDKPVNLHYGGFIATDGQEQFECKFDEHKLADLKKELEHLPERMRKFDEMHKKIKQDLAKFEIIHPDKKGINVIAKFKNEQEQQELTDYCKKNKLEYTICPRFIRVLDNAISIEVKRMVTK